MFVAICELFLHNPTVPYPCVLHVALSCTVLSLHWVRRIVVLGIKASPV